jgi:capsular polysaccharide biosynthesis protein
MTWVTVPFMTPARLRLDPSRPTPGACATELREAAKRILWHWKLLFLCTALGFLVPLAAFEGPQVLYSSSVQLLAHSGNLGDPASAAQAVAQVATGVAQRRGDLHPEKWVHDVQAQVVGNSGVVVISVVDQDPEVASQVANSLAGQVRSALAEVAPDKPDVDRLTKQLADAERDIAELEANPAPGTEAALAEAQALRDDLEIQLAQSQADLEAGLPSVLNTASAETARIVPSSRLQDVVFGALLGLIVGIALAALAEALNPTLVGREAIAAEVRAPVLGVLPDPSGASEQELSWLAWQLATQARRTGVTTLELTTVGRDVDLEPLFAALNQAVAEPDGAPLQPHSRQRTKAAVGGSSAALLDPAVDPVTVARGPSPSLKVRVLDRTHVAPVNENGSTGLVIVTPTVVKRADMEPATDLVSVTGWPLVGVIAYRRGIARLFGGLRRVKRTDRA